MTELESYIGAKEFCTGSQTDFSTCIANNMRFTKYLDDTYAAANLVKVSINGQAFNHVYGKTFVDLEPVAIANVLTRELETNDFGAVKFRCLDVYAQPRLPLPSLQDLGIAASNILDIVDVPELPDNVPDNPDEYEGVPVFDDDRLNCLNFTIGFSTSISKALTVSRTIRNIINNHLNYYDLPDQAEVMKAELERAGLLMPKALEYANNLINEPAGIIYTTYINIMSSIESMYDHLYHESIQYVYNPIVNNIDDNTDFSQFDFSITRGVADEISELEKDEYPQFLASSLYLKYLANLDRTSNLTYKIVSTYAGLFLDVYPNFFSLLSTFYSAYNELYTYELRNAEQLDIYFKESKAIFIDLAKDNLDISDPKYQEYMDVINQFEVVVDMFTTDGIINQLSDDVEANKTILDSYYETYGFEIKIEVSRLADLVHILYNQLSTGLTEINFGTNYKDSGKFYYADIAYAVGFTKLDKIMAIKINDEYYDFQEGVAISESGCTKYSFTRHVLPTYDYTVDMYIYPGTPDQPYCPTINMYHNFATTAYSGMFTKVVNNMVGLYLYKDYRPMEATVGQVVKLGDVDFNSINLNDPSLDQKSYEYMMMTEVKNITNATSINGKPISTDDLKYYTSSKIVDDSKTNNYPTLGIIEFRQFPLGSSLAFPRITIYVEASDVISKGS